MTELRDARLKQALDHAPDAHMTVDERTRAAILAMAGKEVAAPAATAVAVSRWKRWFGGSGSDRMPWNAALATVLLATLVTVIWRNEEVPGARTGDQPIADAPVKAPAASSPVVGPASDAAAAAAATVTAEQSALAKPGSSGPVAAAVPVPAIEPKPRGELKKKEAAPAQSAQDEPAVSQRQEADALGKSMAQAQSVRREDERQRREERSRSQGALASSPANAPAPSAAAPATPAPAPAPPPPPPLPPPAVMSQAAPARASAPTGFAAPAAKAMQPLADRANANEGVAADGALAGRLAFSADPNGALLDSWTQARITLDGKTVTVARSGSGNFAALLHDFAASATRNAGVPGAVVLRAELLRDGELLGVLDVGESSVRRTVRFQQQELVSSGTVTTVQVQDLLGEARRLVGR